MADEREARRRETSLDVPRESRRPLVRAPRLDRERFGRLSETFARFMGTPQFLLYMTVFVLLWLAWNTYAPESAQFDPRALNYTLLTLILSLQASYAAPLILLAQNRQDDRDRVGLEQDRQRAERNLADTEYLAREMAALRLAMGEVATRDFVRSELRSMLDELELLAADQRRAEDGDARLDRPLDRFGDHRGERAPKRDKRAKQRDRDDASSSPAQHPVRTGHPDGSTTTTEVPMDLG